MSTMSEPSLIGQQYCWHVDSRSDALIDGDLTLVPAQQCGLPRLRRLLERPDVYRDWGGSPLSDAEITYKYLGGRAGTVQAYVIHRRGVDLGLVLYHVADDGGEGGGMDMVLAGNARRAGVGTRAARLVTAHVTTQLGWHRLTVDPDVSNDSAIRFWRRAGFQPVSVVNDAERSPYWLMQWHQPSP